MQLSVNSSISYTNDMLPELIWLGLLNDKLGYKHAGSIMKIIFHAVDCICDAKQQGNFALASTYDSLEQSQKEALKHALTDDSTLYILQDAIAPLTLLYDIFPLSFLGPPAQLYSEDRLVGIISDCVDKTFNKYDTPGTVLNGTMLLYRLVTKKIKFSTEIAPKNLEAVIDDPESDDAKQAGAFMRACAIGEFGQMKIDPAWAKYFWNYNAKLSPCKFTSEG